MKNIMTELMIGGHYHVCGDSICDVSIHGELCGGSYTGTDKILNAKKVQASIEYSNNTEFVVFDIRIYDSEGKYEFLSHKDVIELCVKHDIPVVPIIFEGTLDECMQWSRPRNAYPSEIGTTLFNMPAQPCIKVMDGAKPLLKNYLEELIANDQTKKNKAYGLTT